MSSLPLRKKNKALEGQPLYVRNEAQRFPPVLCTVLGLHIDGTFIYPKADGAAIVMKGIQGPEGKRIEVRVQNKTFQYRYQGEENWYDIGGAIDFVGPPGPTGPQGERGGMGGINYRGQKTKLSELPAQASIEGEAYSVNGTLYIRDGKKFAPGGPLSAMNILSELDNIQVGFKSLNNVKYNNKGELISCAADEKVYELSYEHGRLSKIKSGDETMNIEYHNGKLTRIFKS